MSRIYRLGGVTASLTYLQLHLYTTMLHKYAKLTLGKRHDENREFTTIVNNEAASQLEEANGLIMKLKAQVNHNYENSSLPSSKCIGRKKIMNNRERTGRKPGAQPGHEHHPRRKLAPDQTVEIPPDEKYQDTSRYVPTGRETTKQVVGIQVCAVVTQYNTAEWYYVKKKYKLNVDFFAESMESYSAGFHNHVFQ